MQNVLITGANGFLARAVGRRLPATWRATALVRPGTRTTLPAFDGVHDALAGLATAGPIDTVLHLAARIPDRTDPEPADLRAVNVGLVEQLVAMYPAARHVLASSVSVFGVPGSLPLTVASPPRNASPYGLSKLDAERVVRAAPRHAMLRFSSLIGVGMKTGSFVPAAVAGARRGAIHLLGDGQRLQNYLDIDEAAAMCVQAATSTRSFLALAVSGRSHSNLDVAQILSELTGAAIVFEGADASPSFVYDTEGATDVGTASKPLRQTLAEMVKA
jgi:UDP-glucose 4-epimerase